MEAKFYVCAFGCAHMHKKVYKYKIECIQRCNAQLCLKIRHILTQNNSLLEMLLKKP